MTLSRRSFLSVLIAMPAIVKIESLMPISALPNIIGETDFGFTLGNLSSFDEIIRHTLQSKSHTIAQNVTGNKSYLLRIKGKNYVKINYIDPQIQTQRIIDRMHRERMKKRGNLPILVAKEETKNEEIKRCALERENRYKWDNKFIWYEGYQDLNSLIRRK